MRSLLLSSLDNSNFDIARLGLGIEHDRLFFLVIFLILCCFLGGLLPLLLLTVESPSSSSVSSPYSSISLSYSSPFFILLRLIQKTYAKDLTMATMAANVESIESSPANMKCLSNGATNDENDDSSVPQGPFSFLDKIVIRDLFVPCRCVRPFLFPCIFLTSLSPRYRHHFIDMLIQEWGCCCVARQIRGFTSRGLIRTVAKRDWKAGEQCRLLLPARMGKNPLPTLDSSCETTTCRELVAVTRHHAIGESPR
jgi:hypothetical protein